MTDVLMKGEIRTGIYTEERPREDTVRRQPAEETNHYQLLDLRL